MTRSGVLPILTALSLAAGPWLTSLAGCLPTYTFAESGDGAAEGSSDGSVVGSNEGSSDASTPDSSDTSASSSDAPSEVGPPTAVTIVADTGSKQYATGYGEQTHLVFAQNDGRYWFFYVDDTAGVIKTRVSKDLVTWSDGSTIPVGVTDGYNLSVAYADIQGTDVVHLVANTIAPSPPLTVHVRATISNGTLQSSTPAPLPDTRADTSGSAAASNCGQDGPSVTILPDGHVYDVTAWTGHPSTACDTNIYVSAGTDTGSSWTPTFQHDGYYISIPGYTFAHELLTLPDAGTALLVYPDEDNAASTAFVSMGWAFSPSFQLDAGAPGTTGIGPVPLELFAGTGETMSYDDWGACRLSDTDIHVVRHVISGGSVQAFQEVRWNGTQWTTVASPPSAVQGASNTGVALVSGPDPSRGMLLVVIGGDKALHIARWTSTAGWANVATLPGSVSRQSLAGSGCGSPRPTVFWTEGTNPYAILGADLSGLL
jgi:hypothetical protein